VKRYTYRCVRCGQVFDAASPAMHLLWTGDRVEHCNDWAVVIHVEERCGHDESASPSDAPGEEQRRT
jgi:hypothetical protein